MLLKTSTRTTLNFVSAKGNQEVSKSDPIKYAKMNAFWHHFSARHAYIHQIRHAKENTLTLSRE